MMIFTVWSGLGGLALALVVFEVWYLEYCGTCGLVALCIGLDVGLLLFFFFEYYSLDISCMLDTEQSCTVV